MSVRDPSGKRGEAIVMSRLLDRFGKDSAFFDTHHLGEKCQTFDYLVEVIVEGALTPYFFVQVKSTRRGLTKKQRRLKVQMDGADVRKMTLCPLPTYLVGVDEQSGEAYIIGIFGDMTGPISSMPTNFPLNEATLRSLWDEVIAYWMKLDSSTKTSMFK